MRAITESVLIASAVLAGSIISAPRATAQMGACAPQGISVAGEAEVRVAPDQVILTLGVETASQALIDSKTENDARLRRVLESVAKHGVEAKHIQTEHLSIEPYRYRSQSDETLTYLVRRTITVELSKIDVFEELLSDALQAGVTHVHDVQFRTTELRKYRDEARVLAVKAAREKANLLTEAIGRKVGAATSIREDNVGSWSWYGSWWGDGHNPTMQNVVSQADPASSISADAITAPGRISVSARVTVTFDFESGR